MHIIGILTSFAVLVYWAMRAAGSARNSGLTAAWQRKKRWDYSSVNKKSEFDELKTPIDAATALMVALGRDGVTGEVSRSVKNKLSSLLENEMQLSREDGVEKIDMIERLLRNTVQADSVSLPTTQILRDQLTRREAQQLSSVLSEILSLDADPSRDKLALVSSYNERMGLDG